MTEEVLVHLSWEVFKGSTSSDWLKTEVLTNDLLRFPPQPEGFNGFMKLSSSCLVLQMSHLLKWKRIIRGTCVHACMQFAHTQDTSKCPLDCLLEKGQRGFVFLPRV